MTTEPKKIKGRDEKEENIFDELLDELFPEI